MNCSIQTTYRHGAAISFVGIGFVVTATLLMSVQDATVKIVSANLPLWQLFVLLSLIVLPLLVVIGGAFERHQRWYSLIPKQLMWATIRGGLLVAMYVTFYAALPFLQLSTVAAAYYTGPLFILLLSVFFAGERFNTGIAAALMLGFIGVLVLLRLSSDDFSLSMLIPIVSAILYAMAMVLTRQRCAVETPLSLSFALNVCFVLCGLTMSVILVIADLSADIVVGSPFLLGPWIPLDLVAWGVLILLALINLCIHLALARAYQIGPASIVASFDYTYLIFAVFWGYVLLGEVPTVTTLIGMVIIAGAGLVAILTAR